MSLLTIGLIIAAAVIVFILFVPVGIGVKYEGGMFIIIKVAFFSFSVPFDIKKGMNAKKKGAGKEKSGETKAKESGGGLEKGISALDFILELAGDFRRFMRKRISVKDLSVKLTIGTGSADSTAIAVGALWSLLAGLVKLIDLLAEVKKPYYDVKPQYSGAEFKVEARGIIVTRIAYIIAVAFVFWLKYINYKKSKTKEEKL